MSAQKGRSELRSDLIAAEYREMALRDEARRKLSDAAEAMANALEELSDLCPRMSDDDPIAPAIRDAIERGRAALRLAGRLP